MKKLLLLAFLFTSLQKLAAQDGMLYSSFGNNGSVAFNDVFISSAVSTDGKVVAVREGTAGQPQEIVRYNSNGTLDLTFGANGVILSDIDAKTVRIQDDGKIVVGGTKFYPNPLSPLLPGRSYLATARYNYDGSLDASYGITLLPTGDRLSLSDLFVPASGDRVLIKYHYASPGGQSVGVYLAGQSTPLPFSRSVSLVPNSSVSSDPLSSISLPGGSLIVGGQESGFFYPQPAPGEPPVPHPFTRLLLNKYNSDLTLDLTFGNNGIVALPGFGGITNLTLQNDNKFSGIWQDSVIRFNPNGSLDASFGNNGVATVGFTTTTLLLQPNGKLLVGGTLNGDFALTRLNPNGTIDPTFGNSGLTITDFGEEEFVRELAIVGDTFFAYGKEGNPNRFGTFETTGRLAAYTINTTCTPPTFLNTLHIIGNATCGNNDGQISIIPQSGTAPFMYSLDGGATYVAGPNAGFTQFNIGAGTYQLKLKDANGCESVAVTKTIATTGCPNCTPPTFLNTLPIVGDASCDANDGQISIIPTSSTGPFMYSIDGGATYVSGPNAGYTYFNLAPGTYQLRLKDMNGCESTVITRSVVERYGVPTLLNTLPIIGNATCGQSDGQIVLIPTNGTGPFMYSIDGGATYTSGPDVGTTFFNLPAGTYQLRIKTAGGCESEVITRTIENINCPSPTSTTSFPGVSKGFLVDENTNGKLQVLAYPNPSKGRFIVQVLQASAGKGELSIFDGKGTLVQKTNINIGKGNTVTVNMSGKAPGVYYLKVVGQQGISTAKVLLQ